MSIGSIRPLTPRSTTLRITSRLRSGRLAADQVADAESWVRYDYFQPYKEMAGRQANFFISSVFGIGHGTGIYKLPARKTGKDLAQPCLRFTACRQQHCA